MRVVCVSDTHGAVPSCPDGDMLIFAGDFSPQRSKQNFLDFLKWFHAEPHRHRIFIGGNHDIWLEKQPAGYIKYWCAELGIHYLCHDGIELEGLNIWGSPMTPEFFDWAFMYKPEDAYPYWRQIPANTDILITHGPPKNILDQVSRSGEHVGCMELLMKVSDIQPKLHIFGHIHEQSEAVIVAGDTTFVNAAYLDDRYKFFRDPVVVDL